MGVQDRKVVLDSFAWFSNVSTSVLIVFVNKVLMDRNGTYKFVFGESVVRGFCTINLLQCQEVGSYIPGIPIHVHFTHCDFYAIVQDLRLL